MKVEERERVRGESKKGKMKRWEIRVRGGREREERIEI